MAQVSVVIPCFNYGRFLAGAIESLVGQSDEDIEVIVVDDGSRTTPHPSARYPTVLCLRQTNLGAAAACRKKLARSSERR
jgi:glycosyltransferase involved in cell wall biosynthesis